MNVEINANPDNKRQVRGRFRVRIAANWNDAAAQTVEQATGARIISIDGPLLEGLVELETRANGGDEQVVREWVQAGLGVLALLDSTDIEVLQG